MQILAAKLAERQREERRRSSRQLAGPQTDVAWGNQIRSYVLAPYQLVKDLRTEHETGNVEAVLDGDLDDFMRRLPAVAPGHDGVTEPTCRVTVRHGSTVGVKRAGGAARLVRESSLARPTGG